jgi:hypothetical protein
MNRLPATAFNVHPDATGRTDRRRAGGKALQPGDSSRQATTTNAQFGSAIEALPLVT